MSMKPNTSSSPKLIIFFILLGIALGIVGGSGDSDPPYHTQSGY